LKARRSGNCTKDDTDYPGRRKDISYARSVYNETFLPIPDAKVAFELAHGGAIKYKLREGISLSDTWICHEVTPTIVAIYGSNMGVTLGKYLL